VISRHQHQINLNAVCEYAKQVGERFAPEKIILFGSLAKGEATRDSDADLFVIMNFSGRAIEKAYEIRKAIPKSFPLDLLVKRPHEVEERLILGDLFIKEILDTGQVLYEKDSQ
jgi:predicted nucleotidyltransferase